MASCAKVDKSMVCPNEHNSSRSIMEVVHHFLSGVSKFLMIHFNKTNTSRWTGIIFISHCHDIFCLYFHLKCEGMNLVADNF